MFRPLFLSASLLCLSSLTALAKDGALLPRVEAGGKLGTERSLGTGEMWVPLSQGTDRVLYGDIRFMADDRDNNEGNLGLGYRQIVDAPLAGRVIAGGHVWADRRRSEQGSIFYQSTAGAELMGRNWDIRANAYLPLSGDKTRSVSQENGQSSDPYLAGSGIYYDTGGRTVTTMIEEPQPGFDLELGARIPMFEDHIDAVRVYGGGYHFIGDKTEDVSGWRARLVADITPAFSIGGRFQRDAERGSQGFLEATLRFPFEAKRSFREEGLCARLDESPERDVDIVTGAQVTHEDVAPQTRVAVLTAATGDAQRVLHVDNTAAPGGDGSKDHPFNTLKSAEAAMQAYDVIYVHAGDGTTTGQDEGIVIDEPGVSLIGSGTNFVYDAGRFTAASGADYSGVLLAEKTSAPVITNVEASVNDLTGNGTLFLAGEGYASGLRFIDTSKYGILFYNDTDQAWNLAQVNDVYISGVKNQSGGVFVTSRGGVGSMIENVLITNVHVEKNEGRGVSIIAANDGEIGHVAISGVYASDHEGYAIYINARNNGRIISADIDRSILENNTSIYSGGVHIHATNSGEIENIIVRNSFISGNYIGLLVDSANSSTYIHNVSVYNNTIKNSLLWGVRLNDDTNGAYYVDLGGGTLGSVGNNSIYGNGTSNPATYRDMRLDLDGGSVSAQGNWWGQAGGPLAGQIVSEAACPDCGTADTANALDADPNL